MRKNNVGKQRARTQPSAHGGVVPGVFYRLQYKPHRNVTFTFFPDYRDKLVHTHKKNQTLFQTTLISNLRWDSTSSTAEASIRTCTVS